MTESLENYLEMILFISRESDRVRVSDLAARLSVSKPSVHKAMHELEDLGLVEHEPYGDIALSAAGRERALTISERHATLTRFLVDILGVSAENAEKDACAMEHDLSEETLEKIRNFGSTAKQS